MLMDEHQLPNDPITGAMAAAAAVVELVDTLTEAGLKRLEAVYWSAIFVAESGRGSSHEERPEGT